MMEAKPVIPAAAPPAPSGLKRLVHRRPWLCVLAFCAVIYGLLAWAAFF